MARLLTVIEKGDHVSPVLISLNWLATKYRADVKILLFVFKAPRGPAPDYNTELLILYVQDLPFSGTNLYLNKYPS